MLPLLSEVPEPTTTVLSQEDKSFPGCCASPLGGSGPPLPSHSNGKTLSLRTGLPRLVLCQVIQDTVPGKFCSQQCSPPRVYPDCQSCAWTSTSALESSYLPASEVSSSAGGGSGVRLTAPPSFSLTARTPILLGKPRFVTARPVQRSPACPFTLQHSQYQQRQRVPVAETFSPMVLADSTYSWETADYDA